MFFFDLYYRFTIFEYTHIKTIMCDCKYEFEIFIPKKKCNSQEHICLCFLLLNKYYWNNEANITSKCRAKPVDHECVCIGKFQDNCRAVEHKCQCSNMPYRKNYKQPCSKKGFIVNHHKCLCGVRPICFAKEHACTCQFKKRVNLCINGEKMLIKTGQQQITVNFIKFFRTVDNEYTVKYECEIKKQYIIILILCIRKVYPRYFPSELIDYIIGNFMKCTTNGTNMLTI